MKCVIAKTNNKHLLESGRMESISAPYPCDRTKFKKKFQFLLPPKEDAERSQILFHLAQGYINTRLSFLCIQALVLEVAKCLSVLLPQPPSMLLVREYSSLWKQLGSNDGRVRSQEIRTNGIFICSGCVTECHGLMAQLQKPKIKAQAGLVSDEAVGLPSVYAHYSPLFLFSWGHRF